jgi:hypothetical protein
LLGLQHCEALPGERFWIATLPFALLVTGGWALLNHSQSGLYLSLALQAAQIAAWSLSGSVWKFSAGLYGSLGLVNRKFSLFAGWDTSFSGGVQGQRTARRIRRQCRSSGDQLSAAPDLV